MSGTEKYSDIIGLERPVSKTHQPMERINRAAQFAPFASLTGYGAAINETGRRVEKKISLSPSEIDKINEKLKFLAERVGDGVEVSVVYFIADKKKAGGSYHKFKGTLKKVSAEEGYIGFEDGTKIMMDDISALSAPELDALDEFAIYEETEKNN